jgi:hypothetical protein
MEFNLRAGAKAEALEAAARIKKAALANFILTFVFVCMRKRWKREGGDAN